MLRRLIRDWRRGYSDRDLISAMRLLRGWRAGKNCEAGSVTTVTRQQMAALIALTNDRSRLAGALTWEWESMGGLKDLSVAWPAPRGPRYTMARER